MNVSSSKKGKSKEQIGSQHDAIESPEKEERQFGYHPRDNEDNYNDTISSSKRGSKIHQKRPKRLNAQLNWNKLKRLAHRQRNVARQRTQENETNADYDNGDDVAGRILVRRLESNQLPSILLAMKIQRDEKGLPRIPVLLSILKIKVSRMDDTKHGKKLRRTQQLRVLISYGSLQWSVYRRYWDFVKLHYSYCGYDLARARRPVGLPVFPNMVLHHPHQHGQFDLRRRWHERHPIPSLSSPAVGQKDGDHNNLQQFRSIDDLYHNVLTVPSHAQGSTNGSVTVLDDHITLEGEPSFSSINNLSKVDIVDVKQGVERSETATGRHLTESSSLPSTALLLLASSSSSSSSSSTSASSAKMSDSLSSNSRNVAEEHQQQQQSEEHNDDGIDKINSEDEQEKKYVNQLEQYMMQLTAATLHTGNINRLCKFLEISALGIHLKATQPFGYHGKEGYMVIVGRTDREPRHSRWKLGSSCFGNSKSRVTTTTPIKNSPKWFIIRESYMVCVNHPSDVDYCDVFLFEPNFHVQRGYIHRDISKTKQLRLAITSASSLSLGHTTLLIRSNAGELYLRAKNVRQAIQFEQSLLSACRQSTWCLPPQRFNSFAPVRSKCPCTWYVDGKEYFYGISVALENAKNYIYIHDWWLSPEVYLRRPPSENQKWRLDNVLKRKAEQGVKIYVIVYKEVAMAVPLFSHYTKKYLLSLSSNIYVQRHPSRALDMFSKQGTLFYAHHEKICLVDGVVAFIGGLDICFGRYDDAQHKVTDDPPTINEQIWVGKDYSNPRIEDFHALDKPLEDNIDRSRLPRMPWHDISIRLCGQAVRDVEHHFVQRWNFLRRRKSSAPKRETPMLLPSADTVIDELGILEGKDPRLGSQHTSPHAKVQILRSVSAWSTGVETTEHSIMDAYVELIGASKHFLYIENQFFITSTQCGTTMIQNKIGDALYQRILRAHHSKEEWCAMIILPLIPEFPGALDLGDGATIRLIMNAQYLSIGRGPNSLLGRLRAAGVTDTSHYIKFYSLRNWGELNGSYVTEQVYIHAKTMIVDDQTVVIGSANINERSMLGVRDSEICACIEDTECIDSTFGGHPVKVGRFAHSLRLRLMAEHIGIPVEDWSVDMLLSRSKPKIETLKERENAIQEQQSRELAQSPKELPNMTNNASVCNVPDHLELSQSQQRKQPLQPQRRYQLQYQQQGNEHEHQQRISYQATDQQLKHTPISEANGDTHLLTTTKIKSETTVTTQKTRKLHYSDVDDTKSITSTVNDSMATVTHTISEDKMSLYKEWSSWDTDTDNNGDGLSLVPIPLPLKTVSSDMVRKDDSDTSPALTKRVSSISDARLQLSGSYSLYLDNDNDDDDDDDDDKVDAFLFTCLRDPLIEANQRLWHTRARSNTDLFRRCFMVLPDNNIRTWSAFDNFNKLAKQLLHRLELTDGIQMAHMATAKTAGTTPPSSTNAIDNSNSDRLNNAFILPFVPSLLKRIKGHIVIWPIRFLEDEGDNFLFGMDILAPLEIFD